MGDNYSNIGNGWIIGGRNNTYEYPCAEPKPPKKKVDQSKKSVMGRVVSNFKPSNNKGYSQGQPPEEHPPAGAFSFAYSFIPYGQYQYPPPPPSYQYGGYGGPHPQMACCGHCYYEGYHGPGYPGQFPSPNKGDYSYGMDQYSGAQHMNMRSLPAHGGAAVAAASFYGHGEHDMVNKQLGQDNHNHGGAHV